MQSAQDLSVTLDPNLSFDDHIMTTVSECITCLVHYGQIPLSIS